VKTKFYNYQKLVANTTKPHSLYINGFVILNFTLEQRRIYDEKMKVVMDMIYQISGSYEDGVNEDKIE